MIFLKFLMLLALSLWLGGIIFFTAVEAPAILNHVPDRMLDGAIINQSLEKLHWLGIVCGLVFLLASLLRSYAASHETRLLTLPHLTVIIMLACTAISQRFILPAIAQLRAAQSKPAVAVQFRHLHNWSVGLEGAVLLLGLLLLYSQSRDSEFRR
ncbi:MAG TPA: DUF4149 domain-containing protein [Terriglobales bacterium]|jgi:hypothetical protein|nr:DUF4149 domain-containing protein [Terriglobales bacterium]